MPITSHSSVFGADYSFVSGKSALRSRAAKLLARTPALRELMTTLNGAAPGSTASASHKRIAAGIDEGGNRTIETVTDVNRVTTTADRDEINADILSRDAHDETTVTNLNGNPFGEPGDV